MDTSDTGPSTSSRSRGRRAAAAAAAPETASMVVLGPRDTLVGSLTVDGDVRIEGTLDGEVSATGEVNVHPSGTVRAQISARDIIVGGTVEGKAVARELVALGEAASFAGEVHAGRLRVDEGATMNATITMTPSGDAPPARRMEEHDADTAVDVTGSVVSGEGDHGAYGEEPGGSESDAYSDERTAETSGVSAGADSEVG
ncbi:MAG TPA: polymer-forming cytoskeletal protein [Candidatus Dormibacteraeota bacterium]